MASFLLELSVALLIVENIEGIIKVVGYLLCYYSNNIK